MKNINEIERKLKNLQELILLDSYRRKEKVIAINSETFKEVRGKEGLLNVIDTYEVEK